MKVFSIAVILAASLFVAYALPVEDEESPPVSSPIKKLLNCHMRKRKSLIKNF